MMNREQKLGAIREAYAQWEKTATFETLERAIPEDEEKIQQEIFNIIQKK